MTDENTTAINPYMAIEPRKKFSLFKRREDYHVIKAQSNEQGPKEDFIIVPVKDYRRFRGDTRFWQFLFVVMSGSFGFAFFIAMTKPPITVEKPFVVEKQVPVVVQGRCYFLCK